MEGEVISGLNTGITQVMCLTNGTFGGSDSTYALPIALRLAPTHSCLQYHPVFIYFNADSVCAADPFCAFLERPT